MSEKIKSKSHKFDKSFIVPLIIFIIYAFTLIYPFIYLIFNSVRDSWDFLSAPLKLPTVSSITFKNFIEVFTKLEEYTGFEGLTLQSMFFNSITLAGGLTLVGMTLQSMASYVLAKYEFVGNKFIYMAIIIASMVPTVGSLAATYKLMYGTHLANTYVGMICMQASAFGGCFLYLHAYFKAIPSSYMEVARIDGASEFSIFTRIMVPLASKAIKTYGIICFLGFWNDYYLPSIFYDKHPTLAVGLTHINTAATSTANYPLLFAAMIVIIIPVLIFFAIFQKQLLGSISEGGLKE